MALMQVSRRVDYALRAGPRLLSGGSYALDAGREGFRDRLGCFLGRGLPEGFPSFPGTEGKA